MWDGAAWESAKAVVYRQAAWEVCSVPRLPIDKNPSLRRHAASGQGLVTLSGRDHYLGKWPSGCKKPPAEVQAAYDRLIAEWRANGRRPLAPAGEAPGLTVGELILRFWPHVERHYRHPDGTPTGEVENYRHSLRPLRQLYEGLPAAEFSPLKLKAVRETMVKASLVRTLINRRVGRIVRMFKWGVAEELVPETVYRALKAVPGLQKGRCDAREGVPVGPVADAYVEAVLPHVLPPVAAMIRLQRLTGMRPGEVCRLRACYLDVTGPVWIYKPPLHKTAYRDKDRVIAIGPQAQEVLKPFLSLSTEAYLFSPSRALAERRAEQRTARRSKVQPSQRNRRKARPKRAPRDYYTPHAYSTAVRRACELADRLARQQAEDARAAAKGRSPVKVPKKVPESERLMRHWHPHQLRHSYGTMVRRRYGLEAVQVTLGHTQAAVSEIYAEADQALAVRVAAEVG
jgi:integrase